MRFLVGAGDTIRSVLAVEGLVQDEVSFRHPLGKNLKCLSGTADRKRLVAGFNNGGLFWTDDGGRSWRDVTGQLPLATVSACAIDPTNRDRIYAGTNPPGLFFSKDAGRSWTELRGISQHPNAGVWRAPRGPAQVRTIAVSPCDPRIIFVGIEVGNLLRSDDGGRSWRVLEGVCHDIHKVLLTPTEPDLVFLLTGEDTHPYKGEHGFGFFVSQDAGSHWRGMNKRLFLGKRVYCEDAAALLPSKPDSLFLAIADGIPPYWKGPTSDESYFVAPSKSKRAKGADVSIHRSIDGGESWERLSGRGGLPESLFDAVWALDAKREGSSTVVCFGTTAGEVWKSEDGGESWTTLQKQFPPISHLVLLE
jgi:photosystem II stability/assembly factor-like uncharacterized protein